MHTLLSSATGCQPEPGVPHTELQGLNPPGSSSRRRVRSSSGEEQAKRSGVRQGGRSEAASPR